MEKYKRPTTPGDMVSSETEWLKTQFRQLAMVRITDEVMLTEGEPWKEVLEGTGMVEYLQQCFGEVLHEDSTEDVEGLSIE